VINFIEAFYKFFKENRKHRFLIIYGGSASGKSYATAQEFVLRFVQDNNVRMAVMRRTLPSLKKSALHDILEILNDLNIPYDYNKSEMVLRYKNNEMIFQSLDDKEKIKSINLNYVWIEEATEVPFETFLQLNLATRRVNVNGPNQIILSFNPVNQFHWIKTEVLEKAQDPDKPRERGKYDVALMHSTSELNPFIDDFQREQIDGLKNVDPNFYRVYTLGEWGQVSNIVYVEGLHYFIEKDTDWTRAHPIAYGLDFGFRNEMALVELAFKDNEFWERELLYKTNLTTSELIQQLKVLKVRPELPIWCDAAEPDRIQEISASGYNSQPAKKLQVIRGLDIVKSYKRHIHEESVNFIKELRNYAYQEAQGKVLENPVPFRDHLMDAERYAITSIVKDSGESAPQIEYGRAKIPGFKMGGSIPKF
jgi:phage terminase large subunit